MAHTKKRDNGRFTGVYLDLRGDERSAGTFDDEATALRVGQEMETYLRSGAKGVDPKTRATITLDEYWRPWLRRHPVQPATKNNYEGALVNHILPVLGTVRVAELQRQSVRMLLTDLAERTAGKKGSSSTQRHARAALSAMMQTAWDDGYRNDNPVRGIKISKGKSKDIVVMTRDQFGAVHEKLPTWAAQLFANFIVSVGPRYGEVAALLVSDLCLDDDADEPTVTFSKALQDVGGKHNPSGNYRFNIGPTKTHEDRTVALDADLAADLQEWISDNDLGPDDLLFPKSLVAPAQRYRPRQIRVDLTEELLASLGTFVGPNGKEYRHGTMNGYVTGKCRGCDYCLQAFNDYRYDLQQRKRESGHARTGGTARYQDENDYLADDRWATVWTKAVEAAGLPFIPTAYQLRHTHASWAIEDGESVKDVMDRLGHKDLSTTTRYVKKVGAGRKVAETMAAKRTWGRRKLAAVA